ncbi:fimbrial protein [Providencia sp. Je.9.19]
MQGSIMDTACAIDTGSYEQSIDMGNLPISLLRNQGQGQEQSFFITLIGCKLTSYTGESWKIFEISFDGSTNGNWFAVSGTARGVALSLADANGIAILPGKKLAQQNIQAGKHILGYQLRLVSDRTLLRVGQYQTSIRFKLDYY